MPTEGQKEQIELYFIDKDGNQYKVKDIPQFELVTSGMFDQEELHENCTVQILKNSFTGEMSLGWWENK